MTNCHCGRPLNHPRVDGGDACWPLGQRHDPPPRLFYVQHIRTYSGDSVVWWRPDRRGYTYCLDQAGKYTEAEARAIERLRGEELAVPCEVAERAAVRSVDAGRLRDELEQHERYLKLLQQQAADRRAALE